MNFVIAELDTLLFLSHSVAPIHSPLIRPSQGLLEPIVVNSQNQGYTRDKSPVRHRATQLDMFTPGAKLLYNEPKMHVFGMCEEVRVTREKPKQAWDEYANSRFIA